ncbi:hypothetical protein DXG01_016117 [Tephrocybe rancida]|nr:hypothetical protein DXG01_016117 [Tephrocybe rancida]
MAYAHRDVSSGLHHTNSAFAGTLILLCAVAARYSNDLRVMDDPKEPGEEPDPHSSGWKWFSQVPLVRATPLAPPCLYELQFFALVGHFLQASSVPQACWMIVGIGICVAQDAGAHRRKSRRGVHTVEDELWNCSFADGGNTLVSVMMMFLGNEQKVYVLDKAEGNAAQVAGHPAWGSVWDIASHQATVMDVRTNVFCASGMHLPNGSYVTSGRNGAIGRGRVIWSQRNPSGNGAWDSEYGDFDGSKAIRILNPCTPFDNFASTNCQWFDQFDVLSMQKHRWYSTAEALADGSLVLIGGFVNSDHINRNYPNDYPQFEGGAAENTYELYPANGRGVEALNLLIRTSGLNAYAHSFLLNSGKMLAQANVSTMI